MQKENIHRRKISLIWIYVLIAFLCSVLDGKMVHENEVLLILLNTVFIGVIPIAVSVAAGYAYFYSKNVSLLLMSCGMLVLGIGSILTGIMRYRPDFGNGSVTVYNLCMLFCAVCQFGAAAKVVRMENYNIKIMRVLMPIAYIITLLFFGLVYVSAEYKLLPKFVDQHGGTKFLSFILWLSVTGYFASFLELHSQYRRYRQPYLHWYAHCMLMLSVGLVIAFLSLGVGTMTSWVARGTHYLSAIFGLHAVLAVSREVRLNGRSIPYVMEDFFIDEGPGYRNLAVKSSSAMFITDNSFNIRFVNDSALQMLASTKEEIMHNTFLDIFPDSLKDRIRQDLKDHVATGMVHGSTAYAVSVINKAGCLCPAEMIAAYHTTYVGGVCTYILQDVSEREHAYREIARKNTALRTINRVCEMAVYGADVNGFAQKCLDIILKETNSCCGLIGAVDAAGLLKVSVIKHSFHAENEVAIGTPIPFTHGICAFLDFCSSVVNGREPAMLHRDPPFEAVLLENPEYQKGISYIGVPLIKNGDAVCLIALCSNDQKFMPDDAEMLSELIPIVFEMLKKEQAEEALRISNSLVQAIINGTSDTIFLKDTSGRFQMGNRAFSQVLGISMEDLLGKTSLDIYADKRKAMDIMEHDQLVLSSGMAQAFEEIIPTALGVRTYLSSKSVWKDEQGTVRGIIGVSKDITERKEMEMELKKQSLDLELKNKLITDFFINISHEFKTPLSVIVLIADLLEYETGSKAANLKSLASHVNILRINAFRLRRLVSNLLDITKLDAGFMQPRWENVDVVLMLQNLVASTAVFAKRKGLSLRFHSIINGLTMSTDSLMLERIVLNLLSNAIKHTKKGGAICVALCLKGEELQILVKDTGEGIPLDKQDIIFDRFRQVNTALTRSSEGCGIGLSITKSLVELLKGTITFESTPGVGSIFYILLPVMHHEGIVKLEQEGTDLNSRIQLELSDISFE